MKPILLRFSSMSVFLSCAISSADWNPIVLNAVKWTSNNQDMQTITYLKREQILRLPMKYYGGVDIDVDGVIDDKDISKFNEWVRLHIPETYDGPVVMDYETPWWTELRSKTITQERLRALTSVYVQGLQVAQTARPKAQWGYFGLPSRRNTSSGWLNQGLSLEPIITNSNALFPSIYDCNPGEDRTKHVEQHIATILKDAGGIIPVYVFVSPRYCGQDGDKSMFIPDEIFLRHANAAMRATWTDVDGIQHRIKGLILWDAYGYSTVKEWSALDMKHKRYFQLLSALVDAWKNAMDGKLVLG